MKQRRSDEGMGAMRGRRELALALVVAAACGSPGSDPDAAPTPIDGSDGRSPDAAVDAGATDGPDATPDSTPDASVDAGVDAAVDATTPVPVIIGDNGAILEGESIDGTGPVDRREIEIEAAPGGIPDLVLGRAYITKVSPRSDRSRVVIEIDNRSTRTYCDVRVPAIEYHGPAGRLTGGGYDVAVWGSVRRVGAVPSLTCLLPGERGFVLDGTAHPMEAVTAIRARAAGTAVATTATDARLRPAAYTVASNDVSITVENTGTRSARITATYVVYLDGDGAPLGWTVLTASGDADVAAGGSLVVRDNTTLFLGASSDLYVRVLYSEPERAPRRCGGHPGGHHC